MSLVFSALGAERLLAELPLDLFWLRPGGDPSPARHGWFRPSINRSACGNPHPLERLGLASEFCFPAPTPAPRNAWRGLSAARSRLQVLGRQWERHGTQSAQPYRIIGFGKPLLSCNY